MFITCISEQTQSNLILVLGSNKEINLFHIYTTFLAILKMPASGFSLAFLSTKFSFFCLSIFVLYIDVLKAEEIYFFDNNYVMYLPLFISPWLCALDNAFSIGLVTPVSECSVVPRPKFLGDAGVPLLKGHLNIFGDTYLNCLSLFMIFVLEMCAGLHFLLHLFTFTFIDRFVSLCSSKPY